ncbi:MAG: hypothetical protein CM1200mP35_06780 [Chloroflexota bacterium]|nr:MAG: hypothetical protein CM1200mP35_06780 [Chloroflexota bacterium]
MRGCRFGSCSSSYWNLSPDYNHLRLTFFNKWLKTNNNSISQNEKILIFVMGGGSGKKTVEGRLDHGGTGDQRRNGR